MGTVDLFGDSGANEREAFSSEAFLRVIKILPRYKKNGNVFSVVFWMCKQVRCNNIQLEIYSCLLLGGDSYPLTKGLRLICTVLVFSITSCILESDDKRNFYLAPFARQGFAQPDSKVKLERSEVSLKKKL